MTSHKPEAGDTVEITVKAVITQKGADGWPYNYSEGAIRELLDLGLSAEVNVTVTSQYRNGVHLDARGYYWMRRPGSWTRMPTREGGTAFTANLGQLTGPKLPVQRLVEPPKKDS